MKRGNGETEKGCGKVDRTGFGWIVLAGQRYDHDVIIHTNGRVENRYDHPVESSHSLTREEAQRICPAHAKVLVVGTGQGGALNVSAQARDHLAERRVRLVELPTPEAIETFNQTTEAKCALFHVTC